MSRLSTLRIGWASLSQVQTQPAFSSQTRRFAKTAASIGFQPLPKSRTPDTSILRAVSKARRAVAVAATADSDDSERDNSVNLSRHAIRLYTTRISLLESTGEVKTREACEASVGEEVTLLKEELFASRKQRVWMVHSGWF